MLFPAFLDFDVIAFVFLRGRSLHDGAERLGDFALSADDLSHIGLVERHRDGDLVALFGDVVIDQFGLFPRTG